jgi:hypothetical protein
MTKILLFAVAVCCSLFAVCCLLFARKKKRPSLAAGLTCFSALPPRAVRQLPRLLPHQTLEHNFDDLALLRWH